MRIVSVFKNGNNRAIRLHRDMDFEGVTELEITREGDTLILRSVNPPQLGLLSARSKGGCRFSDRT